MNIIDFINTYNGQSGVGNTPENMGQCVGLVELWIRNLGSGQVWGNACDLLANTDQAAFTVTPNSATAVPQSGDIICWAAGWGGSAVGHTAIVTDANVNDFMVFEQNDRIGGGNGACRLHWFANYSGVQGWMRAKALDAPPPPPNPSPSPVPPPAPTPPVPTPPPVPVPVPPVPPPPVTPPAPLPPIPSPKPSQLSLIKRILNWLRHWFK